MGEDEIILHHKYGLELKPGMRVNMSKTPGTYVLRKLAGVEVLKFEQLVRLTLLDGTVVETSLISSWYVEA